MTGYWQEQVQRYVSGQSSAVETAALEKALGEDAELRAWYVDTMNLDVALAAAADAASMTRTMVPFEDRPAVKPSPWFSRTSLRLAAAAAIMLLAGGSFWMSRPNGAMAHFEQVQGEVVVLQSGTVKTARPGQRLRSGDGLRVTGEESSATVVFADGTRVAVGAETVISSLTDDRVGGKRLVLSEGFLSAHVAKQPAGRPMILATPQSEVVVVGTTFNLSSGTAGTHLETQSGKVRLNRKSDGRSVEVPAGFEGTVVGNSVLATQQSPPRFNEPRFTTAGHHLTTALSPDGQTLVTSRFGSGSFTLWEAASGRERITVTAHDQQVVATAFSPDSRIVATGSIDQTIKLWDVDTGRLITALDGPAQVLAISFSNGGATLLALAGPPRGEKTITEWNLATRERRINPQKYPGEAWLFSPSGRMLATASMKTSSVTLWDIAAGRAQTVLSGFPMRVLSMAISSDDSLLAVSDMSGRVGLWGIAEAQLRLEFRPAGQTVHGLAFSADGTRLAMGQRQATVRLWDVADGRQQAILQGPQKPGSTATVRPMFFSADGKTLATTESLDTSTVRLWNLPAK